MRAKAIKDDVAALYMRLSKEDGDGLTSASIETQRKILASYAKENGFTVFDEYIDDGYSGTNFDRPEFQRMKQDIVEGKIGVVITKDFSRLGRNTGKVMTTLDDFFVNHGVRYIAITEGIDTVKSDFTGMLAPMLSFANEMYSGDISRKINASFAAKMKEGEFIGAFAPYGYKKDPKNKNRLLPDEEAASVVRKIFSLSKNGNSARQIADILNTKCIATPMAYRKKTQGKWSADAINKILRNEVYLGHTLQGKTHKVSFKSKHIKNIPKEGWIRAENTHQAIIDKETWDVVRKRVHQKSNRNKTGFVNIFSKIARCYDCGRYMSTVGSRKKGARYNLSCGGYKQYGRKACSSHSIDYDVLYKTVADTLVNQNNFTPSTTPLSREILLKNIEKIDIHQGKYDGKVKNQQIDIYFKNNDTAAKIDIVT